MRTIKYYEAGGLEKLKLEEIPAPEPAPGEVLLRVKVAGLNRLDLELLQGLIPQAKAFPHTPGLEAAGEIARLGENVTGFELGQQVVISPYLLSEEPAFASDEEAARMAGQVVGIHHNGTLSEYIVVPAKQLVPMPENLSFEEAVAQSVAATTAWHALVGRVGMRPGEWALVQSAGSGVGSAAIQVAKLWGAQVIATAGTAAQLEKAEEIGADYTINYLEQDVLTEVLKLTNNRGVDVVVEQGEQETWEISLRAMARNARLVICGTTSGIEAKLDLRLLSSRQLMLIGSYGGSIEEMQEVLRLTEQGRLQAVIDSTYAIDNFQAAFARLEHREHFGKVLLTF